MSNEEIEKIMREAEILSWKENGVEFFQQNQQNHIGILDKIDKLENKIVLTELKLNQEG